MYICLRDIDGRVVIGGGPAMMRVPRAEVAEVHMQADLFFEDAFFMAPVVSYCQSNARQNQAWSDCARAIQQCTG